MQIRWELACQRWDSANAIARQARSYRVRGVACRSGGSWLASDGIQRMPSRGKLAPTKYGVSLADPVGAGLPAMESSECHRETSSLLQSAGRRLQILWELACQGWDSANAIARQARSYRVRGCRLQILWELACQRWDSAVAIARQARSCRVRGVACRPCESWLAWDGIQRMPSRGKLAPAECGVSLVAPVGAGLPGMGFSECHREASSLLQSTRCRLQILWELACQRWDSANAIARQTHSGFNVQLRPLRYELHHVASTPDRSRSDARAGRN